MMQHCTISCCLRGMLGLCWDVLFYMIILIYVLFHVTFDVRSTLMIIKKTYALKVYLFILFNNNADLIFACWGQPKYSFGVTSFAAALNARF